MIDFDFDKNCYGCKACKDICPQNAIKFEKNDEGFEVPVIDKSKCVNCKLCSKVCVYLNEKKENDISETDKIKIAYRKENKEFKTYTSSGVFSALAKKIIDCNGYVAGCVWNENMEAKHVISNDINMIKKMACSKYVQSDMGNLYIEIKEKLENENIVLFSGTPCQVASIKNYFKEYKNLYTVGIVCHGTPSPEIWKLYKEKLEKKYKGKMINANFRYKGKYGWITPFTRYEFDNNKIIEKLSFTEDEYVIAFGEDILHRNTCYTCKYKGTNSNADLIIGDFWGCSNEILRKSKNKGVSAIIVHTKLGNEMIEYINDEFIFEDIGIKDMIRENPPVLKPVNYNLKRDDFFKEYKKNKNIEYLSIGMNGVKYKIKKILYKFFIFEWLKRIKYYLKHK